MNQDMKDDITIRFNNKDYKMNDRILSHELPQGFMDDFFNRMGRLPLDQQEEIVGDFLSYKNCLYKDCRKTYKNQSDLDQHIKTVHTPYECKINDCGKLFTNKYHLNYHIEKTHLNISRYRCRFCDKPYKQSNAKNVHERIYHTNELPYKCQKCGDRFHSKYHITKHEKLIHTEVKLKNGIPVSNSSGSGSGRGRRTFK